MVFKHLQATNIESFSFHRLLHWLLQKRLFLHVETNSFLRKSFLGGETFSGSWQVRLGWRSHPYQKNGPRGATYQINPYSGYKRIWKSYVLWCLVMSKLACVLESIWFLGQLGPASAAPGRWLTCNPCSLVFCVLLFFHFVWKQFPKQSHLWSVWSSSFEQIDSNNISISVCVCITPISFSSTSK